MRSITMYSYTEGVQALYALLGQLTVHRNMLDAPVFRRLSDLLRALSDGDMQCVAYSYHAMTSVMVTGGYRRVSGCLWRDYLFHELLENPNAFSRMAAARQMDNAVYSAMRGDLAILGRLSELSDTLIKRWAEERMREARWKPRQAKDAISYMSSAAWGGGSLRPAPKEEHKEAAAPMPEWPTEADWHPWQYGDVSLADAYVSDEALEEMYMRLMESADWRAMTDDMWNFFASYGCGKFLKNRAFIYGPGGLKPMPSLQESPPESPLINEEQHQRLIENTIRFMRGEPAENILLWGPPGTGKTTRAMSMLRELPEVRLILVVDYADGSAADLFHCLRLQPLKFVVLMDNMPQSGGWSNLLSIPGAQPENVLIYATLREKAETAVFPVQMRFEYPDLNGFTRMVADILENMGQSPEYNRVRNACVDYQVDVRDALTPAAARHIANGLLRRG